ncbi:MAG: hypothetical protein R6V07_16940 [Armatimonadota bacterium]
MRTALAALAAALIVAPAWAGELQRGPSPEVAAENAAPGAEIFRVRVHNTAGGAIEVSPDEGAHWLPLGRVTTPATAVNPAGYTASKWAQDSSVAASAVNALHVKVANHPETGRGIIFSLVPEGTIVGAAGRGSTSIVTDIPGGDAIFGGGFAPWVNSPVSLESATDRPLPADYEPSDGDRLIIRPHHPPRRIAWLDLDNSFGGLITARYIGGEERTIGMVLRPVVGIGRFEGTREAAPGRIRANHPGVIDISTSPQRMVGGFQIVPSGHADSPEVAYVRTGTQWMVVGPLSATSPSWEGVAPLFSGYLRPSYGADDLQHDDWMFRLLARAQVQVRFGGGDWELMPKIAIDPSAPPDADTRNRGREGTWRLHGSLDPYTPLTPIADTALAGLSHIRIFLPRAQWWPGPDEGEIWWKDTHSR